MPVRTPPVMGAQGNNRDSMDFLGSRCPGCETIRIKLLHLVPYPITRSSKSIRHPTITNLSYLPSYLSACVMGYALLDGMGTLHAGWIFGHLVHYHLSLDGIREAFCGGGAALEL